MKKHKIILVGGARPNFMKVAPLYGILKKDKKLELCLVHTGQHYSQNLSDRFFKDLRLPSPRYNLKVGSGESDWQIREIANRFERVLKKEKPDLVVVVGDVNSTIACARVTHSKGILLAHVEAGLRSFDLRMPEEKNRILTDRISDILFTTSPEAFKNLTKEGIDSKRIYFVGNVMIDALKNSLASAQKRNPFYRYKLKRKSYLLLTLHRPSNVDHKDSLLKIWRAIKEIIKIMPVLFPIHPRTRSSLQKWGLEEQFRKRQGLIVIPPLGYLDFLAVMKEAALVLTDSGGVQEESIVLRVPCITLRENTERPITLKGGMNRLVGQDPEKIVRAVRRMLKNPPTRWFIPLYWDGKASQRIEAVLRRFFHEKRSAPP